MYNMRFEYAYYTYNIFTNILIYTYYTLYAYIIHKHRAAVFVQNTYIHIIYLRRDNIGGRSENILLKYAFLNIYTDQKTRVG